MNLDLWTAVAVASCLLASAACTDESTVSAETGSFLVRDSAGIEIVEVPAAAFEGLPEWTLSETPILRIGQVDGPEEQIFGRLYQVARFQDGSLAVMDRMTQEIRVFDEEGAFLAEFGGQGEGPGEFAGTMVMDRVRGDSLALFDLSNRRVSVLSRDGVLGREYSTQSCQIEADYNGRPAPCQVPWGMMGNGSVIFADMDPISAPPEGSWYREVLPMGVGLFTGDDDFQVLDTVGQFPAAIMPVDGSMRVTRTLYGARPVASGSMTHLIVGRGDQRNIRFWTPDGRLDRIIRLDPPRPVTEDDLTVYRPEDWGEDAPMVRRWLEESTPAPVVPLFGDSLLVDTSGKLWMMGYRPPPPGFNQDPIPRTWFVFDEAGAPMARIDLPSADFAIHQLDPDAVTGVAVDSLGLGYAVVYGVTTGGGAE